MSGKLSRRGGAVDPFIVMDVMAAAAEKEAAGDTVIHLEVGQPSTPAPKAALAAAHAALDTDRIGYVAALGMPALRQRIARHYRDAYGVEVSSDRVIVTTGSSGGFPLAFLASFDAGDRVALAAPGYPAYRNILAALNLEAVDLPTSNVERQPRPDKPIFLTIKSDLSLAIGDSAVSRDALQSTLDQLSNSDRSMRIFLRADKTVPYGDLMEAMNTLRSAGYLKVALVGLESDAAR